MLLFNKPKIEFHCAYRGFDFVDCVVPAKDIMPEWWKKIPSKLDIDPSLRDTTNEGGCFFASFVKHENRTVKKCPGIVDLLKTGWVLTMWCDLLLRVDENSIISKFSIPGWETNVGSHPDWQMIDHLPEHIRKKYFAVYKPGCPVVVKTSPGYSTLHLDPFYFFNPNFDSAEGYQYSDLYHDLSPQLLLKAKEMFIPKGTPLQIIIPIKRESIEGKILPYSETAQTLLDNNAINVRTKFSSAAAYNEYIIKRLGKK